MPLPSNPQRGASAPSSPRIEPQRTRSTSSRVSRQTTRERIDEILEAALERADQAKATTTPMFRPPDRRPRPRVDGSRDPDEHTADERTGIISRENSFNYQSTNTSADHISCARNPPSTGRAGSAPPPHQQDPGRLSSVGDPSAEGREAKHGRLSWYDSVTEPFRSIELENKGSVARDHLAIERTFLAWLRTSLAFASIGIAVTQLFRLNTSLQDSSGRPDPQLPTLRQLGKPLGATFLGTSIVILFLGYHRYRESQRWVMEGKFPASRGVIILVTFLALGLAVASLVVVVVVNPREKEL